MLAREIIRSGAVCALFSFVAWGQPALTTISDVRLKADGARFNGLAQVTWLSFDSANGASIAQQSTTVRIIDGNLLIQLTPTSNATPLAQYLVLYESDGKIQFQETWNVTPSTTPLRIADVRTSQPLFPLTGGGGAGGLSAIQESDVIGLIADLTARAVKGPGFSNSRTAIINDTGQIEGAVGAFTDCIHVDGTAGACGAGASPPFSAITPGTNTGALLVGTGGSLAPTGTGTITPSIGTGLAIVGNAAVTDSAIIPQVNAANVFTAGFMQTFTGNATLPPTRLLGAAFSDRTLGNFGFDTVSKRPAFADGSSLFYGMANPGTTIGDIPTCTTNATPCTEGAIAAGSSGLFLRSNGGGAAPSYAIPNFSQIGGLNSPSQISSGVNAQTGTSYTYADSDRATLVTHSNAASIAGTFPQANGTTFTSTWFVDVQNRRAGTLTITPIISTIDGNPTLALTTGQGARIFSDGANYFTQRGIGTLTFNGPPPPANSVACYKAGGVLGWASNTSGVIGTSCN
jgi:hypothetical protein